MAGPGSRTTWRHQQVLDLQHPDAYAPPALRALMALLDEYAVDFLKWDHNRDLVDVAPRRPTRGARPDPWPSTGCSTRSGPLTPSLEIESCASGGGRVDLGVLRRTDRVWPSDTLDPLLRVDVQRWTTLLVPPELVGTHVGGAVAHTTGRHSRLGFRAAVALLGHFGIEWDLQARRDPRARRPRCLGHLPQGDPAPGLDRPLVRPDHADPAVVVTGAVAQDRREAVFVVAVTGPTATQIPAPVRLAGLDPRPSLPGAWDRPVPRQARRRRQRQLATRRRTRAW